MTKKAVTDLGVCIRVACVSFRISESCYRYEPKLDVLAQEWGIRLEYIQPGNPQQNAYVERFNRTVRYEWLSQYYWSDLAEVQDFAARWMWSYNHDRPNMALGGFTPKHRVAMAA